MLPEDIACAKDTKDLIADCCKGMCPFEPNPHALPELPFKMLAETQTDILHAAEFVTMISTEANDICEKELKKTISPEHILAALKVSHRSGSHGREA